MKNIKKSYIAVFILLVLAVVCFSTSYAIFMNVNEQSGKLNIVVGDLTYRIESDDLVENKLTVAANTKKELVIKLTSLNEINSKYELYYLLNQTNENLQIGYSEDTKDPVLGTIDVNETKEITVIIKNNGSIEETVEFSVIGGLVNNELVLNDGNSLNQKMSKYTAYSIGDSITLSDGSKWHVLEDSDETNPNIVLLSDYNLNSDGTYNTTCGKDINNNNYCSSMVFDTNDTNIYDEYDSNNIGYFIRNIYQPLVTSNLPGTTNITLPTAFQIAEADLQTFNYTKLSLNSSWLLTTNYWTKTSNSSIDNYLFGVHSLYSGLGDALATSTGSFGTRPTITTLKSNIVNTMTSSTALSIGTPVTAIDGSKWHVLEASDENAETVTLLSDYNLNSDGTYNTECGRDVNGEYSCNIMAFDSNNAQNYDETDSNNIGYFIKNIYEPLVTSSLPKTSNVTLPTASQIAIADSQIFNQSNINLNSSWLITTNYWTKTSNASIVNYAWYVYGIKPGIYSGNVTRTDYLGARPVITTPKSNLILE